MGRGPLPELEDTEEGKVRERRMPTDQVCIAHSKGEASKAPRGYLELEEELGYISTYICLAAADSFRVPLSTVWGGDRDRRE